jgi:hypothetical protein
MSELWEDALMRLEVVDISTGGDIGTKLQKFDLVDAHCYNPNDEHKIREAIEQGPGGKTVSCNHAAFRA